MSTGNIDPVLALVNEVRFAFQPLINVKTGAIVGVEALARPTSGPVQDLFQEAARHRRLTELDVELARTAVGIAADHETLLPLHVNLFGGTVANDLPRLERLSERLQEVGRRAQEVVLEIGPPFARLDPAQLVDGVRALREEGFQIAVDGVGQGDVPLTMIADMEPTIVKLDRAVISALPDSEPRRAVLEAVRHLCEAGGADLVAEGVENDRQLTALRRNGVRLVQGNLLAPPARRPPTAMTVPGVAAEVTDPAGRPVSTLAAGPRVTEFLSPATLLPAEVTADKVREVLADHPEVSGVVLVDDHNRPQFTIDRNRFLLAVTGPYGHALHAKRPASRLADEPRVVTTANTAMEALNLVTGSDQYRMYDDAIVVDESGRCLGAVRAGHLIRGMADLKVEEAAALNPLTRLPGSDTIARDVSRRIAAGEVFAVGWLDIDGFKSVNDQVGFSAGDDLIRAVGRSLTDAATSLNSVQVGHVGGDDFLLVADLDDLVPLAELLLDPDREAGGVPVTLSLATLVCTPSTVSSYDEVSRMLAPLKLNAKSLHGSSWVMSRPGSEHVDVLRGKSEQQTPLQIPPGVHDDLLGQVQGEPAAGGTEQSGPAQSDTARNRPAHGDPTRSDPAQDDPAQSRPARGRSARRRQAQDDPAQTGPAQGDPAQSGSAQGDSAQRGPAQDGRSGPEGGPAGGRSDQPPQDPGPAAAPNSRGTAPLPVGRGTNPPAPGGNPPPVAPPRRPSQPGQPNAGPDTTTRGQLSMGGEVPQDEPTVHLPALNSQDGDAPDTPGIRGR